MSTLVFALGTENKMKVAALEEFLKESGYVDVMFSYFGMEKSPYEVIALTIPSNVSDQPKSLEETLQGDHISVIFLILTGARNRSKGAFDQATLQRPGAKIVGLGIESGITAVPGKQENSLGKFFNVTTAAVYNGSIYAIGMGPSFALPERVTDIAITGNNMKTSYLSISENLEVGRAFEKLGLHEQSQLKIIGAVDYLTRSRINRKELVRLALLMAFQEFENKELFEYVKFFIFLVPCQLSAVSLVTMLIFGHPTKPRIIVITCSSCL
jgi:non-canonical (house-cleaning) NTP pyrophosphatase